MLTPDHILYEDNHLLVVNKEAGWLTQGDQTGDETVADFAKVYLKEKYHKPGNVFLGVVHRLDRPVSGVLILARTSKALSRMTQAFKKRQVQKIYWALVSNQPKVEAGTLIHYLEKDQARNVVKAYDKLRNGSKEAELTYQLTRSLDGLHLLEVNPLTGRPHQIRVQLAAMGCPILGDLKYGASEPLSDASIGLHARSIAFTHPVKNETITVIAPLPRLSLWKPFSQ